MSICKCQQALSEYSDSVIRWSPAPTQLMWCDAALTAGGDVTAGTWSAQKQPKNHTYSKGLTPLSEQTPSTAPRIQVVPEKTHSSRHISHLCPPLPHSAPCVHSGGDGSQGRGGQRILEKTDEQHPENLHFHGGPGIVSTTGATSRYRFPLPTSANATRKHLLEARPYSGGMGWVLDPCKFGWGSDSRLTFAEQPQGRSFSPTPGQPCTSLLSL